MTKTTHTQAHGEGSESADETPPGVPSAWLAAVEGRVSVDEAFPEPHPMREVFTPLDDAARARIVQRAVEMHFAAETTPVSASARGKVSAAEPARRSVWARLMLGGSLAWAVAASALLALHGLPLDRPDRPGLLGGGAARLAAAGEVTASSSKRSTDGAQARGALHVPGDDHFVLVCAALDRSLRIIGVDAVRPPGGEPAPLQAPGFKVLSQEPHEPWRARLHVRADLELGAWSVTCTAVDPQGRVRVLATRASIVID
jgi:hypothetical protein